MKSIYVFGDFGNGLKNLTTRNSV